MTELEIAGVAANGCFKHGAEELEGPSFVVCSGERSGYGVPAMPTDRRVRPGDFVIIDINGVSFNGYRTCFYRTYLVGDKPTQFQKEVYGVTYDALMALQSAVKPGITTKDVQTEWMKLGDFPGGWGREPKFQDYQYLANTRREDSKPPGRMTARCECSVHGGAERPTGNRTCPAR